MLTRQRLLMMVLLLMFPLQLMLMLLMFPLQLMLQLMLVLV
jgi:hypothetical protein